MYQGPLLTADGDERRSPAVDLFGLVQRRFGYWDTPDLLRAAITRVFPGRIAVLSSFGAESAVVLRLVADIDPATPVIFLDTGKQFADTLGYRDWLTAELGLTDVRSIAPEPLDLVREDPAGDLHRQDPDRCCHLRKVLPFARALRPFDAWITGRKRFQGGTRAGLAKVELDAGRMKFNPLADWDGDQIEQFVANRGLPRHPLVAEGYLSIGCAPCTSPVAAGEDPRAGRWRGRDKTECGIHLA